MSERKRWQDLGRGQQALIIAAAVAEAAAKAAALVDLARRPASEVRGPKALWAAGIIAVNGLGVAPAAYFAFGRRPQQDQEPIGTVDSS